MLATDQFCFLCLRPILSTEFKNEFSWFKKFVTVIKRQVNLTREDVKEFEEGEQLLSPSEWAGECEDCSGMVKSAFDLYGELKVLEMKLNWRLWTISKVMRSAEKVPNRLKTFDSYLRGRLEKEREAEADGNILKVKRFRRKLRTKCDQSRLSGFPKVTITRVEMDVDDKTYPSSSSSSSSKPELEGPTESKSKGSESGAVVSCPGTSQSILESSGAAEAKEGVGSQSEEDGGSKAVKRIKTRKARRKARKVITISNNDLLHTTPMVAAEGQGAPEADAAVSDLGIVDTAEIKTGDDVKVFVDTDPGQEPQPNESKIMYSTVPSFVGNEAAETNGDDNDNSLPCGSDGTPNGTQSSSKFKVETESDCMDVELEEAVLDVAPKTEPERRRSLRAIHRCDKCEKTFSNPIKLEEHQFLVHGSEVEIEEHVPVSMKNEPGQGDAEMDSGSDTGSLFQVDIDDEEEDSSEDEEEEMEVTESETKCQTDPQASESQQSPSPSDSEPKSICINDSQSEDELAPQSKVKVKTLGKKKGWKWPEELMTIFRFRSIVSKPLKHACTAPKCDRKFLTEEELTTHAKLHRDFKCEFCDFRVDFAPDLAFHESALHSAATLDPLLVQQKKEENLGRKKFKGIRNTQVYFCARCPFTHRGKLYFLSHFLMKHLDLSDKDVVCPLCKLGMTQHKTRTRYGTLLAHFRFIHDVTGMELKDIYRCQEDNCPAFFRTRRTLDFHRHEVHGMKFECVCGNSYSSRNCLSSHYRTCRKFQSGDFPNFECDRNGCGRRYRTKEDLESHIKLVHNPETAGSYKCTKCPRTFWRESHLKFHMAKHENEKKKPVRLHQCEECGKGFKVMDHLNMHRLSHLGSGSWEWQCSTCGKKCLNKWKLEEHQRVHSKAKPFVCHVCGVKYAHRHNLRIHVSNKHGDDGEGNLRSEG